MGTFFAYSIQSAICLALFYLFYKVLLCRDTFHRFNRMALLGMMFLSFIIPAALTIFPFQQATTRPPNMTTGNDVVMGMGDTYPMAAIAHHTHGSTALALLLIVYLFGCTVCLAYTIISLFRIIQIIRKGTNFITPDGTKLILLNDAKIQPFSWMNFIVCSKKDYEEAGATIILHEKTHIQLHHSKDLLLAQIGIITQWFNPAAWLLYRELQNIHEYEADDEVIRKGIDAKQYQLLIIKKAVGTRLYSMANSFSHSNLKKRITMMLQKKSNPWARLKYAYVLPLAATTVALFAQPEISAPFEELSTAKVSHFSFETSKNEVKNLPEVELPVSDAVSDIRVSHPIIAEDSIYYEPETPAAFPGGEEALLKWISEHMKYPDEAVKDTISGRVYCQFVIEKDGSVTNVEVRRGVHPLLNKEAVRTLQSLPKFKPAENKGVKVRSKYSVPVRFKIA